VSDHLGATTVCLKCKSRKITLHDNITLSIPGERQISDINLGQMVLDTSRSYLYQSCKTFSLKFQHGGMSCHHMHRATQSGVEKVRTDTSASPCREVEHFLRTKWTRQMTEVTEDQVKQVLSRALAERDIAFVRYTYDRGELCQLIVTVLRQFVPLPHTISIGEEADQFVVRNRGMSVTFFSLSYYFYYIKNFQDDEELFLDRLAVQIYYSLVTEPTIYGPEFECSESKLICDDDLLLIRRYGTEPFWWDLADGLKLCAVYEGNFSDAYTTKSEYERLGMAAALLEGDYGRPSDSALDKICYEEEPGTFYCPHTGVLGCRRDLNSIAENLTGDLFIHANREGFWFCNIDRPELVQSVVRQVGGNPQHGFDGLYYVYMLEKIRKLSPEQVRRLSGL
jgi:hypothetical protein